MIGEVEANDILERRQWVANLLLIAFEVITVILLMNLMVGYPAFIWDFTLLAFRFLSQ